MGQVVGYSGRKVILRNTFSDRGRVIAEGRRIRGSFEGRMEDRALRGSWGILGR
jgi:hypothetical protein